MRTRISPKATFCSSGLAFRSSPDISYRERNGCSTRARILALSSSTRAKKVGSAPILVISEGRNLLVYVDSQTEKLMVSQLAEGKRYAFIVREASLSQNPNNTLSFDLLSFDALN